MVMVAMVIMKGSWEDDLMIPWISLVGDDDNHYNDDDGGGDDSDDHLVAWLVGHALVDDGDGDNHYDDDDGGGDDSDDHLVAWLVGHGVERASPARHHARSTPSNHYHLFSGFVHTSDCTG